jgi:preprotein translocase subunit SecF
MSFLQDLYRNQTNVDFRRLWRYSVAFSAAMALLTVVLLLTRGLNLSIDFEGGGVWQVPVADGVTVAEGREASGLPEAKVQLVQDPDGQHFIRVQAGTDAVGQSAQVVDRLAQLGGVTADEVSVSTVGPTWGSQITAKAVRALILFFIAVALYLAWRLEWRMAAGAIVAVIHDLGITAGVYALFGFEVSPATVIALLTILGYSLYDTVVVYDKVLDNQDGPMAAKLSPNDLVVRSMNQVLMRSLNTTVSTILPVLSMLVIGVGFLKADSLRDFALALFIGLILGTYSSIFVAAPMLVWLKERDPALAEAKARPSTRRSPADSRGGKIADERNDGAGVRAATNGSVAAPVLTEIAFPARPRKKKRRS